MLTSLKKWRKPWNGFRCYTLQGIGLGRLAALDGVGWESKKKEPSTIKLQRPIVILRCARNYTVARYFRLCATLRQTLNPKPPYPSVTQVVLDFLEIILDAAEAAISEATETLFWVPLREPMGFQV